MILTYYPLGPNFVPKPTSEVSADFAAMVTFAGATPLVLQEVGYPSSPVLTSSEQAQSDFVREMFDAWKANAASIPFVAFYTESDFTQAMCDAFVKYYGVPSDKHFSAYLCSAGLRRSNGAPKIGWQAFADGAAALAH